MFVKKKLKGLDFIQNLNATRKKTNFKSTVPDLLLK